MVMVLGPTVSTVMAREAPMLVLPAASVALMVKLAGPSPMAVMSAGVSV